GRRAGGGEPADADRGAAACASAVAAGRAGAPAGSGAGAPAAGVARRAGGGGADPGGGRTAAVGPSRPSGACVQRGVRHRPAPVPDVPAGGAGPAAAAGGRFTGRGGGGGRLLRPGTSHPALPQAGGGHSGALPPSPAGALTDRRSVAPAPARFPGGRPSQRLVPGSGGARGAGVVRAPGEVGEGLQVAGRLAARDPPLVLLADGGGEAQLQESVEGAVGRLQDLAEQAVDLLGGDRGQRQPG